MGGDLTEKTLLLIVDNVHSQVCSLIFSTKVITLYNIHIILSFMQSAPSEQDMDNKGYLTEKPPPSYQKALVKSFIIYDFF